jgi:3-phenylpropionate/trans-cinnamate dioxygenase ferredoxin reductase subunit
LSKEFLARKKAEHQVALRPESFYDDQGIRLIRRQSVVSVDRRGRTVKTMSGNKIGYNELVVATGSSPHRLREPVLEAASNVHYLRSLSDSASLRDELVPGARICVLGGGYIGLEVASVARQAGLSVTVVEAAPQLLARVAGVELATFVANLHRTAGVDLRLGSRASAFRADEAKRVVEVTLTDGAVMLTDIVVVAIGIVPNDQLAGDCGLQVADGVVVGGSAPSTEDRRPRCARPGTGIAC